MSPFWRRKSLAEMTPSEWESLCDGCGKCCTNSLEDEETGELFATSVACRLFCNETAQCGDYPNRKAKVPECIQITPDNIKDLDFLPVTCAYRLVWLGRDLPDWHHLVCGDRERIHQCGYSVRGSTVDETVVARSGEELEDYMTSWPTDPRFL